MVDYREQLDGKQDLHEARLASLLELNQLTLGLDANEFFHKALLHAVQLTRSETGFIHFVNQDQKTFQLIICYDDVLEGKFDHQYPLDQASTWNDYLRVGKPVVNNDYQNVTDKKDNLKSDVQLNRKVSVPFYSKDKVRIILSVENKAVEYDSTDILLLTLISEQFVKRMQHNRVEKALITARHQYEQFAKYIPVGIYQARTTTQEQLTFEHVNQRFCEMLNLSPEEVYEDSKNVFDIIHPDDLNALLNSNTEVMRTRQSFLWEGRALVRGKQKWLRVESRPELLDNGDVLWHGVQIDITDRKQVERAIRDANTLLENRLAEIEALQEQLREEAIRDYLTRLFNRRYLDETIEREISRAEREARKLSVVMMDIDHFKGINDTFGHQAGDLVLTELGALLKRYSRASDIACRHGGDEFVVVMPNASAEDAHKRADEWRRIFESKRFTFGGRRFATTLSMGIASYPVHASSPKGVFQAADQALYQSKMHNNTVTISRRVATRRLRSIRDPKS
jgi:diguanylate cyclase (GGDEF)-like protein/PAS domain S-box-containing protein